MTIASILRAKGGEVVRAAPDTTLRQLVAMLTEHRIGAVPVLEGERLLGVISERDVIHAIAADGGVDLDAPVAAAMTSPAITAAPDMPLLAALSLMTQRRIRHLPILSDGRLAGFVSIGDLVKARIERIESEAAAMRDYIAG